MGIADGTADRRHKVGEWLARYAPAEVAAILGALLAVAAAEPFGLPAATAYAGALGDGIGFYAVLFVRDLRRSAPGPRGRVASTVRGLVLEFGPAEVLDSFVVRPLAMYLAATWLGNATAGAVAGKIAADAVFYAVAIVGYELRRHLAGRQHVQARGSAPVVPRPLVAVPAAAWPGPTLRPVPAAPAAALRPAPAAAWPGPTVTATPAAALRPAPAAAWPGPTVTATPDAGPSLDRDNCPEVVASRPL